MLKTHDGRWMTDNGRPQKLALSMLCSGEAEKKIAGLGILTRNSEMNDQGSCAQLTALVGITKGTATSNYIKVLKMSSKVCKMLPCRATMR